MRRGVLRLASRGGFVGASISGLALGIWACSDSSSGVPDLYPNVSNAGFSVSPHPAHVNEVVTLTAYYSVTDGNGASIPLPLGDLCYGNTGDGTCSSTCANDTTVCCPGALLTGEESGLPGCQLLAIYSTPGTYTATIVLDHPTATSSDATLSATATVVVLPADNGGTDAATDGPAGSPDSGLGGGVDAETGDGAPDVVLDSAVPEDAGANDAAARSDSGEDAAIDAPSFDGAGGNDGAADAGLAIAHLYVSSQTNDIVSRFRVVASQVAATPDTTISLPSGFGPAGLAVGTGDVLYVSSGLSNTIDEFSTPDGNPTKVGTTSVPLTWVNSGITYVPSATPGGSDWLWVASASRADAVFVFAVTAGTPISPTTSAALVATGLNSDAGATGIQGIAWDSSSSSLFVAATDQVHRLRASLSGGVWTLTPVADSALKPLGAQSPRGLATSPNPWLIAVYPTGDFLNLGYWSVGSTSTTFLQGAAGSSNSFFPVAVGVLPTQPATEPVRLYVATTQNQIVAIDATSTATPTVTGTVCDVNAPSWLTLGP